MLRIQKQPAIEFTVNGVKATASWEHPRVTLAGVAALGRGGIVEIGSRRTPERIFGAIRRAHG